MKKNITLDHGSGGRISNNFVNKKILPLFDNPVLCDMDDSARLTLGKNRLAFSTDSYVVDPIFFPGGNIGDLAINGTVNDISMSGAVPKYLSIGLIIEEGFPMEHLEKILLSMKNASEYARVDIVTGDTKVVPKGALDKIFINTSGVGVIPQNINISGKNAKAGDQIIISGTIADHGITILTQRENLTFESPVISDTAPLNHMVQNILACSKDIHVLRDPTRGGVATTLNEIAIKSDVGIKIHEEKIPVKNEINSICELLGFDPLYMANEGKLIAFVPKDSVESVLEAIKNDPSGKNACIVGEVTYDNPGKVFMETIVGGTRIVDMLSGEQLPRIC